MSVEYVDLVDYLAIAAHGLAEVGLVQTVAQIRAAIS